MVSTLTRRVIIFTISAVVGAVAAYMYTTRFRKDNYANQYVHAGAGGIAGPVSSDPWLNSSPSHPITEQDYTPDMDTDTEYAPGSVPQVRECLDEQLYHNQRAN